MNKYEVRRLPLTVAVSSTLAMSSLQAATITVNSALDAPVGTYQYVCTLRAAIEAANSDSEVDGCVSGSGVDDIEFLPGLASSTITLGSSLIIRTSQSISGPMAGDSAGITISGDDAHQAIRINQQGRGGPIDVTLQNLTIERGFLENDPDNSGGGIGSIGSSLTLRDVAVIDSYSEYGGGGLAWDAGNYGVPSTLTLEHTLISRNSTGSYNQGGGLLVQDANLSIFGSEISQNTSGYRGGGLYVTESSAVINDTLITGNAALSELIAAGGGVYLSQSSLSTYETLVTNNEIPNGNGGTGAGIHAVGSTLSLLNSEISDNRLIAAPGTSYSTRGAGIYLLGDDLAMDQTVVSGNSLDTSASEAYGSGAGIWASDIGLSISYSTITDNTLATGTFGQGGGASITSGAGTVAYSEISNNLVSGDDGNAGGIIVLGGSITVRNTTISSNQLDTSDPQNGNATSGLVMIGDGSASFDIVHSTLANNRNLGSIPALSVRVNGGVAWTLNQSLLSGPIGSSLCNTAPDSAVETLATDTSCTGVATSDADLALQPLADNGGPTRTHALDAPSVAIDLSGDCAVLAISKDQRGVDRDEQCDVGAFEFTILVDEIFGDRFERATR